MRSLPNREHGQTIFYADSIDERILILSFTLRNQVVIFFFLDVAVMLVEFYE